MDDKHFRNVSEPNPYASFGTVKVNDRQYNLPIDIAPDNRYPSWPAIMADSRYTDYSPRCSKNIPVGEQFPTKQWLINNTEQILDYSRTHQFPTTQALDASVLPPPAQIVECSKYDCSLLNTNMPGGIGIERVYETPYLFGTFSSSSSSGSNYEVKSQDAKLTQLSEGGRNSRRGNQQLPY
jgi:hypothetical protein